MKILDSFNEFKLFKDIPIGMVFKDNYTYIKIGDDVVMNAVRLDTGKIINFNVQQKVAIFPNSVLVLQGV